MYSSYVTRKIKLNIYKIVAVTYDEGIWDTKNGDTYIRKKNN